MYRMPLLYAESNPRLGILDIKDPVQRILDGVST